MLKAIMNKFASSKSIFKCVSSLREVICAAMKLSRLYSVRFVVIHVAIFPLIAFSLIVTQTAGAQVTVPNESRGEAPGTRLAGPVDPDMGRLANIQFLGGHIITIPETPGSEGNPDSGGDHQRTQAWDISDPSNPFKVSPTNPDGNFGDFGRTGNPILAHGTYSRANEIFIGLNTENQNQTPGGFDFFDSVRLNDDGTLSHARWSGPTSPELFQRLEDQPGIAGAAFSPRRFANWSSKGAMMQPWAINDNWSYNQPDNLATLSLRNVLMAEWDISRDTNGVSGFGNFLGNLLIYVSDQLRGGLAIYDATDIRFDNATSEWKPRLLSVLNTSGTEPDAALRTIMNGVSSRESSRRIGSGGVGGYWSEISGHYIVIGRETVFNDPNSFDGIQIVDFEDPNNAKLHCEIELKHPGADRTFNLKTMSRYIGLQDNFAFVDGFKVNIESCEVETVLDVTTGVEIGGGCVFPHVTCPQRAINTGEYARIIGNLWVTGGFPIQPDTDGMGLWVHQSSADSAPPKIAHQVPSVNQTNYPVNAPLGFSIPETLRSETIVSSENRRVGQTDSITLTEVSDNGNLVDTGVVALDYVLSHQGVLTLNPVNLLKADTTYELAFSDAIQDAVGNRMQAQSFRFSTGDVVIQADGTNTGGGLIPALISNVIVSPNNTVTLGDSVSVTVVSNNASLFQISLDGENSPFSPQNSRSFIFDQAGVYFINLRARNDDGDSPLQRISISVLDPNSSPRPGAVSSQLVCDEARDSVWAVNPNNNSISNLAASSLIKREEIGELDNPQSVAKVDNRIWVSSQDNDRLHVFDADTRRLIDVIEAPYGSGPSHILASTDEEFVYVSFFNSGQVARYSVNGGAPDIIDLDRTVKAMALSADGSSLLVARLISTENWGEVFQVDTASWQLERTFRLYKHLADDSLNNGRGKPNYLSSVAISANGQRAYVVAKKDNIDRGLVHQNDDLDDDNAVRTIGIVLDLESGQEIRQQRIDFDNTSSLSAVLISPSSQLIFIAEQGRNAIRAIPIDQNLNFIGQGNTFATGLAPQGLCFDQQRSTLFVKNFTERSVTAIDLTRGPASTTQTTVPVVEDELLSASELSGLQLFYNAFEGLTNSQPVGRISAEGYISCASCHLDGGEDGNTWDFTGRGEGLRNNISLRGRGGLRFGNVHWTANFDEIQDFEHDIRGPFSGRGFLTSEQFASTSPPLGTPKQGLSQALDDLAAYVSSLGKDSLGRSHERDINGALSVNAVSGRSDFQGLGCQECHSGAALTDGQIHDVGTLRPSSGQGSGESLIGIKTPSLLGVFSTAPYLHDGSAKTIEQVFNVVGGSQWEFDINAAEQTTFDFNGSLVVPTGYSYLRDRRGVKLNGDNALAGRFADFTEGLKGRAKIRVRYGSALSGGQLDVLINDVRQGSIGLEILPQVDGQDVNYTESESLEFDVPEGEFGFVIALQYKGDTSVIIDDFTVSSQNDIDKASPHTKVSRLVNSVQQDLISYVSSLDRQSAPEDDETDIFQNPESTDPNVSSPDALCFPVVVKASGAITIICL